MISLQLHYMCKYLCLHPGNWKYKIGQIGNRKLAIWLTWRKTIYYEFNWPSVPENKHQLISNNMLLFHSQVSRLIISSTRLWNLSWRWEKTLWKKDRTWTRFPSLSLPRRSRSLPGSSRFFIFPFFSSILLLHRGFHLFRSGWWQPEVDVEFRAESHGTTAEPTSKRRKEI